MPRENIKFNLEEVKNSEKLKARSDFKVKLSAK